MKFLLICSIAIVSTATAQNNDWKQLELKGKVKSVKIDDKHRYKKDGVNFTQWENMFGYYYQFNTAGRYTEVQQFFGDGSLNYKTVYNQDPKTKKAELSLFDKDGKPNGRKSHRFNDGGNLSEIVEYLKDGKFNRRYVFTYNDNGKTTSTIYYKADSTLGSTTSWTYSKDGREVDWQLETPGYATSYKKYRYNAKGNLIEELSYDKKKEVDLRIVLSYDVQGNKIEEAKYKGLEKFLHKTTWTYEYDKAGNWTKRTQHDGDGIEFRIEVRTIVYY